MFTGKFLRLERIRYIQLGILVLLLFIVTGQSSASDRAYVIDTLKITLRTGPSNENKITSFLNSGQLLEVMETRGDWCRVKVLENGEVKTEGWVLKQYLTDKIPYKIQVDNLMEENKKLKEDLASVNEQANELQKQEAELSALYQKTQEKLDKLKQEFDSLKNASSDYLRLKDEYEINQINHEALKEKTEKLDAENTELRRSQSNIWFATGALVLLCGLMIGIVVGRQSRKRSSVYY